MKNYVLLLIFVLGFISPALSVGVNTYQRQGQTVKHTVFEKKAKRKKARKKKTKRIWEILAYVGSYLFGILCVISAIAMLYSFVVIAFGELLMITVSLEFVGLLLIAFFISLIAMIVFLGMGLKLRRERLEREEKD